VLDEKDTVILKGVRLFDEANKANNEERRNKRHLRRLYRRKKQRKEDFKRLASLHFPKVDIENVLNGQRIDPRELNILALRNKAIKEQVSEEQLIRIFYFLTNHRGTL
jgi:CRISPR/Cas system Type II protein with McrA/HNH and RuvC-like nuclease domain